jgi:hypothetical protein
MEESRTRLRGKLIDYVFCNERLGEKIGNQNGEDVVDGDESMGEKIASL